MTEETQQESAPETKALEMGWIPKEQFKGDPEKWVDATTFVDRGEHLLPIIKATSRKQGEKIQTLEAQLRRQEEVLTDAQNTIKALKEFNSEINREKAKAKRSELARELRAARESGDVESELEIQDQLTEHSQAIEKAEETPKIEPKPDPTFLKWKEDNSWFGNDPVKTALTNGIAQKLRSEGETSVGRAFLDKVAEAVEEFSSQGSMRTAASKVGGSRNSGGDGESSGGGKTYSDLPPDAKTACERQGLKFIGKSFKSSKDWREHYVRKYFEE